MSKAPTAPSAANTTENPLAVTVPNAGFIFTRNLNSAHNEQLLATVKDPEKLTRKQRRALTKRAAELESALNDYGYNKRLKLLESYEIKIEQLRAEYHNAPADEKTDELKERIQRDIEHERDKHNRISLEIGVMRPVALELQQIEQRIEEDAIARANAKLYPRLRERRRREIHYFASGVISTLTQLGYAQRIDIGNKRITRTVQIERGAVTEDEVQFKIKTNGLTLLRSNKHMLPAGVRVQHLVNPETLEHIAAALGCPVSSPNNDEALDYSAGAYIVIHRVDQLDGLFNYIRLKDVLAKYPRQEQDRYPFPIGVTKGRYAKFSFLDSQPHLMLNGATGSGKTNAIRAMLTTWIQNHSPHELRLFITDLKLGADFADFSPIPHLDTPIIYDIDKLSDLIFRLTALMQQRMKTLRRRGQYDIKSYNAVVTDEDKMPRIILVIDECSALNSLIEDKKVKEQVWRALALLATQARAAGIHLLLGTQQSFSDTIPREVRDNITFVLSGQQRTLAASLATFSDGKAKQLPNIKGRMYCYDGELYQTQTPHATHEDIKQAVRRAQVWERPAPLFADKTPHPIAAQIDELIAAATPRELVIRTALEEFEGVLTGRKIAEFLNDPRISRTTVFSTIEDLVNERIIAFEGNAYKIGKKGKSPVLVQIKENEEEIPKNPISHETEPVI